MATSHVTDEELSAAKQRARVLIARQAARAPDDDDLTVVKKALVQELLQRERERVRERECGRAFADHLSRNDEWTVKDYLASAYKLIHLFTHEMVSYLDVLRSLVEHGIVRQSNASLIVLMDKSWFLLRKPKVSDKHAQVDCLLTPCA